MLSSDKTVLSTLHEVHPVSILIFILERYKFFVLAYCGTGKTKESRMNRITALEMPTYRVQQEKTKAAKQDNIN